MLAIGPSMQQHTPTPQIPPQQQQQSNLSPHSSQSALGLSSLNSSAGNQHAGGSGPASAASTPFLSNQQLPATSSTSSPSLSSSSIPHPSLNQLQSLSTGNVSPLLPTNGFTNPASATPTPPPNVSTASPIKSQTPNPVAGDSSPKLSVEELKARAKAKGKQPATSARISPIPKEEDADVELVTKSPTRSRGSKSPTSSPKKSPKKRPSQKELLLDQYVNRDLLHAAALSSQSHAHLDLIRSKRREIESYKVLRDERRINPASVFGYGYQGFGNAFTDGKTRILYPVERKRPGGRRARELQISRASMKIQAETAEDLIPIRLDISHDKIRLRDTFTWNLHEKCVPIDLFAEHLIEDFHLPASHGLVTAISRSMIDQITDYHPHVFLEDQPLDPHLPYSAYKNDDMRVLIKINITIGDYTLIDQFEWDINNPQNSPEEFAECLTREMSLSGEFCTAVAHSIREQAQLYSKYLYFIGYPFDGRPIEDEELRTTLLQSPITQVLRPVQQVKDFSPQLWEIPEDEVEKQELAASRESKRSRRRPVRRVGLPLPELKDIPKTHRTQIVSTVLPGAVEKISDMRIFKDKIPGDSESEDEDEETPEPQTIPTRELTTRGGRGVRTAAQVAAHNMRFSAARSATPEVSGDFHPSSRITRGSANHWERRPGVSHGAESLVVRLKVNRAKLSELANNASMPHMQHQFQMRSAEPLLQRGLVPITPQPNMPMGMMYNTPGGPPPPGPDFGMPMMLGPPGQTSVPRWLEQGLALLRQNYPQDQFEGIMRQVLIDTTTGNSVPQSTPMVPPGRFITDFTPRIRCVDCPGKLYTPGPGETVENFEIHLKNRIHRERVEARISGVPFVS